MADESGRLIPRPSAEALAWRSTAISLAGSAAFLWTLGLVAYAPGAGLVTGGVRGAVFAVCTLSFLIAHEAGHLLAARVHAVPAGPPWFLPIGAVLRLREVPPDNGALVEIGAWGPIAGVVALVALLVGRLALGPLPGDDGHVALSAPALWWLFADAGPSAADPAVAAFHLGCLVTALNLVPFGQLDGGHLVAGLWPARATAIGWVTTAVLLALGFAWPGYAVWAAVVHLAGSRMPLRARRATKAPPRAWASAVLAWIALLSCASAAPFTLR